MNEAPILSDIFTNQGFLSTLQDEEFRVATKPLDSSKESKKVTAGAETSQVGSEAGRLSSFGIIMRKAVIILNLISFIFFLSTGSYNAVFFANIIMEKLMYRMEMDHELEQRDTGIVTIVTLICFALLCITSYVLGVLGAWKGIRWMVGVATSFYIVSL